MKLQNVCVIGGAGFLGSHLVDYLVKDNSVLVLDNLIAGRREFVNPLAKFIWCDITHSEKSLEQIFKQHNISYVFNYAAEPYVPSSYDRPLHTLDINTRGALMVMNAAQAANVVAILQISSAEIYGDQIGKINEEHPARPHSTYGAAKLAIDTLVQTRWKESACPVISLRQFNCLGERDVLHPYVVPAIYTQLLKSPEVKLGNNSFRDFMYAGDQARFAVDLLEYGEFGEVYNLGSEAGLQIYELAELIAEIMGKEIEIVVDESRKRKWEIWNLCSDNTKIYKTITTRPAVLLEDAIKKTISYYDQNPDKWAF
jgi:nucleoside-diphosphate-sugar epimerase